MVLDPAWRIPALVQYISALNADLACLQEVESEVLAPLQASLGSNGYGVYYARKNALRPEGVAIFYRLAKLAPLDTSRLDFNDGEGGAPDTGYVALIASFRCAGRIIGVINTHLFWDPPGTRLEFQRGYRQARELVAHYEKTANSADAWILAGDFNATPDSAPIAVIRQAGFDYSHMGMANAASCNVNGAARLIDYIFHSSALRSEPGLVTPIDNRTVLPSAEQPSDHVAIAARLDWRS